MSMHTMLSQVIVQSTIACFLLCFTRCEPIATLASSVRGLEPANKSSTLVSIVNLSNPTAERSLGNLTLTNGSGESPGAASPGVPMSNGTTSSSSSVASSFVPVSFSPASPASPFSNQAYLPPPLSVISSFNAKASRSSCVDGLSTFELVTGFSYVGRSSDVIKTLSDTMNLPDCLHACSRLRECKSINFETGLCVLLNSSANYNEASTGSTPGSSAYHQTANGPSNMTTIQGLKISQFPVFTIYAEKICLEGMKAKISCSNRAWTFERVIAFKMAGHLVKKKRSALNRIQCMEFCLDESSFECRSFNYNRMTGACWLFDVDRQGISSGQVLKRSAWLLQKKTSEFHYDRNFIPSDHEMIDFFENNCIKDPKQCDFAPIKNLILKTVDSVYENVRTFEACKAKCLNSSYRCFSFDFGADSDPKVNGICRTSHLNTGSVVTIESPFAEMSGAVTYQLVSCLNVTVECNGMEMIARIKTNRVFNGKIYAKSKPNSCVNDVSSSLDFSLTLPYNDVMCDVKNEQAGNIFSSQLVIQHHDRIVTQSDFGVSVMCRFDLKNRTISNGPAINIDGSSAYPSGHETMIEATSVRSPNVTMRIADFEGNAITSARVGDTLNLHFDIIDNGTPYEIFVRDLVAVDGTDTSEIQLIDSIGCPTEMAIMTSVAKFSKSGKRLRTTFEAFKFPSSNTVQFRALITPCLSSCKPVQCNLLNTETGINQEFISYGRRRRSISDSEDMSLPPQTLSHSTGNDSASENTKTNSPVIEALNNHYRSGASTVEANYRGIRPTPASVNGKVVNDDLIKDEITNSNNNHDEVTVEELMYTYNTDKIVESVSTPRETTPIDPKSQVVVVGAIKISDAFDFNRDNSAGGNDAPFARGSDLNKHMIAQDTTQDKMSSLLKKSFADVRGSPRDTASIANDCVNMVTVIITCIIFLLGQLTIIFMWYYLYKKIQMYQWLSSTLFPAKNVPKSSCSSSSSSSIGTLETSSTESIHHSSALTKCLASSPVVHSYVCSPPAPVRVFRSRYPFESNHSKHITSSTPHLPFACHHQT